MLLRQKKKNHSSESPNLKLSAVVGLGFAYANTRNEEVIEHLTPIVVDVDQTPVYLLTFSKFN